MATIQEFLTLDPNVALAKVEAAIALGAKSVNYDGNTLTFRSMDDLYRLKGDLTRQILNASKPRKRATRLLYNKHG